VSSWRKCDTCRKVLPVTDFDGDATTCRACLAPAPAAARRRSAPVTSSRPAAARPVPVVPAGPRAPLLGTAGRGDLEVRERRAKRAATDALVEQYAQEYARLLRAARAAEGLRPMAAPTSQAATVGEPPQTVLSPAETTAAD